MFLVKKFTQLLELSTSRKLARAERRNNKAVKRVKQAKRRVDKSNFEYGQTQAEVLIQLSRLNGLQKDIGKKRELQAGKAKQINALLESIS